MDTANSAALTAPASPMAKVATGMVIVTVDALLAGGTTFQDRPAAIQLAAALKPVSKVAEVEELMVAIGTVVGGKFLVIDAEGIAHLMEETSDGVGTDDDTEVTQRHGNLVGSSPGPLQPSDGIASGVVFEQELDQRDDVGGA